MATVAILNDENEITTGRLINAPYGLDEGCLVTIEGKDCNGNKFIAEGKLDSVLED